MRQIVVMIVMVGLCLSALPAQAQTVSLREAATSTMRAATATNALQAGSSSPQRRRSVGRTVGGIILMGLGAPILLVGLAAEAVEGGAFALAGTASRSRSTRAALATGSRPWAAP